MNRVFALAALLIYYGEVQRLAVNVRQDREAWNLRRVAKHFNLDP